MVQTYSNILHHDLHEHSQVIAESFGHLKQAFESLSDCCVHALRGGGKLLFLGNGGSAADSQHIATELTVRFRRNRPPIAAIALTTDTSALTAIGNDFGFDDSFSRQVEALGRPGDVVIGISTSGNSGNVVKAIEAARRVGCITAAFCGGTGGALAKMADHALVVPSAVTARIQEVHILLGHSLCGAIEHGLGY